MSKSSKPAEKSPVPHTPVAPTVKDIALEADTIESGPAMTTNQGLPVGTDQNSLKAGARGPTLLEDFYFREKIMHFDHERIPERVVHARGVAAHGYFECTADASDITKAGFLTQRGKRTPVFLRFSTVAGSRGSADTPRDVRGFAIKFYTDQGVYDMVGNNIPVFFIQDAIKFPDLIHAVKPEPHNEIPQAASAHDTFYDFISLTPEAMHMIMWVMSDRTLPRSLSMMEGFGIHTFRFINAKNESVFVKLHFKPKKGVHSFVWDESAKLMGKDPDFHRRDLWESIERGDFPEWEFGVQVIPESDELKYGFDILDPTKIVPEELVPVRPLGKLVLNRNPDNYFAETEQVAFSPGNLVPGIDFSNDPLLQGRLFSYLDTQIKRVGQNFAQLPINLPTCPFSNNQRDGEGQQFIHKGRVAYSPNTLAGGCPMHESKDANAFRSFTAHVDGNKIRERSDSFSDHFSQAAMFFNSLAQWEKDHIIAALSFELNMCDVAEIKQRVLDDLLINVADELANTVAANIGMTVKKKRTAKPYDKTSPALSMAKPCKDIVGRKVALLAADGVDAKDVKEIKTMLEKQKAIVDVIAKSVTPLKADDGSTVKVAKPAPNAASVAYDAVIIPGGKSHVDALLKNGLALHFVAEAFTHGKAIAVIGDASAVIKKAGIDLKLPVGKTADTHGVVSGPITVDVVKSFVEAMKQHKNFDRAIDAVPA